MKRKIMKVLGVALTVAMFVCSADLAVYAEDVQEATEEALEAVGVTEEAEQSDSVEESDEEEIAEYLQELLSSDSKQDVEENWKIVDTISKSFDESMLVEKKFTNGVTSSEINTYADASIFVTNLNTLKNFLTNNGKYTSDGYQYDTIISTDHTMRLIYNSAKNRIMVACASSSTSGLGSGTVFSIDGTNGRIWNNLVMGSYYPYSYNTDLTVNGTSTDFNNRTYTEDTTLNFSMYQNTTGKNYDWSTLNELYNTHLRLTIAELNVVLYSCVNLEVHDIGFLAWNSDTTPDPTPTPSDPGVKNGLVNEGNVFKYYENNVWIKNKYGFVEYNGNTFLVANGVLAKVNGLVNDPNGTKYDWYFCAEGRVVKQHSGFCMYNGKWFLVKNGKLENNATGFYGYDGGLFYMAEGRLLKEANGLMQDPRSTNWYFCANGQAQTSYTGLALYNGTWFYVENGYFDPTYWGFIDYNGRVYEIENGTMIADYGEGNVTEKEPNSSKASATQLALNIGCGGEVGTEYRDVDWYKIDMIKDRIYRIAVYGWNDELAATSAMADLFTPSNYYERIWCTFQQYGDDYIFYRAPETGTYYIKIYNYSGDEEHFYCVGVYEE